MKKALLFSVASLAMFLAPHFEKAGANFVDNQAMASKLVEITNGARSSAGLGTLSENSALTRAAYAKAEDMLARSYFSHTSPGGKAFYRWVDSAGYEYVAVAENLAVNLNMVSAEQMVSSWLNSPGHRANLLSSAYTETGIGVSSGTYQGQSAVFAVQIFASPKNKPATKISSSTASPQAAKTKTGASSNKTSRQTKPAQSSVVKNVEVLGAATSTLVTSPSIASSEPSHENLAVASEGSSSTAPSKNEATAHKTWLQKIMAFLLSSLGK